MSLQCVICGTLHTDKNRQRLCVAKSSIVFKDFCVDWCVDLRAELVCRLLCGLD